MWQGAVRRLFNRFEKFQVRKVASLLARPLSKALDQVRDKVGRACSYCAASFGVKEDVHASDIPLLEEYEGHLSIQKLVAQDYQVILSNPYAIPDRAALRRPAGPREDQRFLLGVFDGLS